jgi:two-component system LytT family response regulator
MKSLTALIVDDEGPARRLLARSLAVHPEITVIGDAGNVDDAHKLCRLHSPDVIFLDINMPQKTGFDLIPLLKNNPLIVFVTAYTEYAVNAFQVGVCDYLLKPFSPDRIALTVERLVTIKSKTSVLEAFKPSTVPLSYHSDVVIRVDKSLVRVLVAEIAMIKPDREFCYVYLTTGKKYMLFQKISYWEKLLPKVQFHRISRFYLVNIKAVVRFDRLERNESQVIIKGCEDSITLARAATIKLRVLMRAELNSLR